MIERLFTRLVRFSPELMGAIISILIGKLNVLRSRVESGKTEKLED